ncbi:YktB family protein [Paenibacillus sp. NRS-1782]|uniref:YktB family protein n=1 Tax=unclassified Paenibacillus TaxID=185978 RepID=UPI003D2A1294
MTFSGFTAKDFDVFEIPGLEPRMEVLIEQVRPKLEAIGAELASFLTDLCGEPMHVHVARHARRKVNPPKDSWVAWAANKRGYKALPHFEVGMFASHLFVIFAIIYESPNKATFAQALKASLSDVRSNIPDHFYWSMDHMAPEGTEQKQMDEKDFQTIIDKLQQVKKAEVMCGIRIDRDDPLASDGAALLQTVRSTFERLLPLYQIAFSKE